MNNNYRNRICMAIILATTLWSCATSQNEEKESAPETKTQEEKNLEGIYLTGIRTIERGDKHEGVELVEIAAELGHENAQLYLGKHYHRTPSTRNPFSINNEAAYWYFMAAEQGNLDAMHGLASVYLFYDDELSEQWLEKAARRGHIDSMHTLGLLYSKNNNSDLATRWLLSAARSGHTESMAALGSMYYRGEPKDTDNALLWLEKAAERGSIAAAISLANIYGNRNSQDYHPQEAFKYIKVLAESGLPNYQYELAELYKSGIGTLPDHRAAMRWLQEASYNSQPYAQVSLMMEYYSGRITNRDFERSYAWAAVIAHTHPDTIYYIDASRVLNNVSEILLPHRISMAQNLSKEILDEIESRSKTRK